MGLFGTKKKIMIQMIICRNKNICIRRTKVQEKLLIFEKYIMG